MLFEKNHKMLCVPLAHIIVPLTQTPKVYRSVIASGSTGDPKRYFCTFGEKGANKHKSEHCRLRQCDFKSAVCAVRKGHRVAFGSDIAYAVILSSTVILRCSDICPLGKLWIYLNFGASQNITCKANITLTKSKYNLRSSTHARYFVLAWKNAAQKNTPLGVFLKVVLFCRVIFRRIR